MASNKKPKASPKNKLDHTVSQINKSNAHLQAAELQSKESTKKGDATRNTAGFVDLAWIRAERNEAFLFPRNFAVTVEHMVGDSSVEKVLKARYSKLLMMNWQFSYKDKTLLESPQHRFVLEYFKEQIQNYGGMKRFIKKNVLPAVKYGISVFAPTISIETKYFIDKVNGIEEKLDLAKIEDIFWYHPATIYRIYLDKNSLNRVGSLTYWLSDKATVDFEYAKESSVATREYTNELSYYEKNKVKSGKEVVRKIDNGGAITLTNIDVTLRGGGVISYQTEGSNPVGKPYIYSLYAPYLLSHYTYESAIKLMSSTGLHSLTATPLDPNSIIDGEGALAQLNAAYREAQESGGGLISSNTHKVETLSMNELREVPNILSSLFGEMMRTHGDSVEALGIDGAGTRNVADAFMKNMEPDLLEEAEDLAHDINSTFMKNMTDMNWGHWMESSFLKQYPILEVRMGDLEEVVDNAHTTEQVETEEITIDNETSGKAVAASSVITTQDKNDNMTSSTLNSKGMLVEKKFVKRLPNNKIEEIIIDVEDLERTFVRAEKDFVDALNRMIQERFIPIIKKSKGDPRAINKALEREIKYIKEELLRVTENTANDILRSNMDEFLRGAKFTDIELNISKIYDKTLKKYSKNVKDKIDIASWDFINKFSADVTSFLKRQGGSSLEQTIERAIQAFSSNSQYNYLEFAKDMVFSENDNLSSIMSEELNKKTPIAIIRTAILEGSCGHCVDYDGTVYYMDEEGDYYNTEGIVYRVLPDSECLGMVYARGTCRCKWITAPKQLVQQINEKQIRV